MIEQGLFQKHFVGRDGFVWWTGQVVSDSWKDNIEGSTNKNVPVKDHKGFDYRYQVRIMGYHPSDKEELADADLPWATIVYPVTAGGGGGTFFETPNIRQGNFVYGFFFDGLDAQQPVIMGILGYNVYQEISKENPSLEGYAPFLGYPNKGPGSIIASYAAKLTPDGKGAEKNLIVSDSGSPTTTTGDKNEEEDGKTTHPLKYNSRCEQSKSPGGMEKDIQNMIQSIEKAQRQLKNAKRTALNSLSVDGIKVSLDKYKDTEMGKAAVSVSGFIKKMVKETEKFKTEKITQAIKDKIDTLLPTEVQEAKQQSEKAMDLVKCLFRKIIGNILGMVKNVLNTIVDRYINAPLCAMENIVGAILGKLTGFIDSSINAILAPLQALLGITDIAGDALGFVTGLLSLISCNEKPACAGSKGYSIWDGSDIPRASFDPLSLVDKVKDFASSVSQSINPDNFNFDLDMNFSDLVGNAVADCNVGPILCGPPKVEFFGGSGSGAKGNAILNAAGQILGVDIISSGSGYASQAPIMRFIDDCGNGQGGEGEVEVGPVDLDTQGEYVPTDGGGEVGVTGVVVTSPGTGYIPIPNGSQGGDGRVWADYTQTTLQHQDGVWDVPYDPGEMIPVVAGDIIRTPIGSSSEIGDTPIPGGINFEIPSDGEVTAPSTPESAPDVAAGSYPLENLQYPVILYLCDALIGNGGFGYEEGDKVVIEPSYGAEIVPTFGPGGDLVGLKVTSGGEGIKEIPEIYIESKTGFNAEIIPKFCVDRVTDEVKIPKVTDKLLSVVDCVGKV